ncbi:MAG TPA: kelch repeat-containing protein [Gemmatimonadales bacterium]|nr:kelch repeat-containing protein [Gemmatimonadales bacterium]
MCHSIRRSFPLLLTIGAGGAARPGDEKAAVPAHAESALAIDGTLQAVASMHQSRAAHTATLLGDGRVLIVGGMGPVASATVERYDTGADTFSEVPSPRVPRSSHTATRLADGTVLVTGGYGTDGSYLQSAERFDPATDSWHEAGTMTMARAGHRAVQLADGRLLLLGGVGTGWRFLRSAEIYDPATDRFTPTGSMAVPRESHVAVRLADGRVLVMGGHAGRRDDMVLYASAELYDPTTGQFTATGDMGTPRHKHDAVLLADGRVLVTGGADRRDSRGQYNTVERYDPTTGRFEALPPMLRTRYKHAGTTILLGDGRVLLAGGADRAEVYDPDVGMSAIVAGEPRLPGLFSAVAPLPDGGALITGGYGQDITGRGGAWRYRP